MWGLWGEAAMSTLFGALEESVQRSVEVFNHAGALMAEGVLIGFDVRNMNEWDGGLLLVDGDTHVLIALSSVGVVRIAPETIERCPACQEKAGSA